MQEGLKITHISCEVAYLEVIAGRRIITGFGWYLRLGAARRRPLQLDQPVDLDDENVELDVGRLRGASKPKRTVGRRGSLACGRGGTAHDSDR